MVKKDAAIEPKGKTANAPAVAEDKFNVGTFLQGTKEELGKVVWLSATLIYLVDRLFGWVSGQVF